MSNVEIKGNIMKAKADIVEQPMEKITPDTEAPVVPEADPVAAGAEPSVDPDADPAPDEATAPVEPQLDPAPAVDPDDQDRLVIGRGESALTPTDLEHAKSDVKGTFTMLADMISAVCPEKPEKAAALRKLAKASMAVQRALDTAV